jgi:hypothetical protein
MAQCVFVRLLGYAVLGVPKPKCKSAYRAKALHPGRPVAGLQIETDAGAYEGTDHRKQQCASPNPSMHLRRPTQQLAPNDHAVPIRAKLITSTFSPSSLFAHPSGGGACVSSSTPPLTQRLTWNESEREVSAQLTKMVCASVPCEKSAEPLGASKSVICALGPCESACTLRESSRLSLRTAKGCSVLALADSRSVNSLW